MAKRKRKALKISEELLQRIAEAIVSEPDKPLKYWCGPFEVSYGIVYRALKERVNVRQTLTLRYPSQAPEKPTE